MNGSTVVHLAYTTRAAHLSLHAFSRSVLAPIAKANANSATAAETVAAQSVAYSTHPCDWSELFTWPLPARHPNEWQSDRDMIVHVRLDPNCGRVQRWQLGKSWRSDGGAGGAPIAVLALREAGRSRRALGQVTRSGW